MNPRDASAEFLGKKEQFDGWFPRFVCQHTGREHVGDLQPLSREPREVEKVACPDCRMEHSLIFTTRSHLTIG